MDEIKLMLAIVVGKRINDAGVSVTDERRVVSDRVDIIGGSRCLVLLSIDREIQECGRFLASVLLECCLDGVIRTVAVLAVALHAISEDSIGFVPRKRVGEELLELAAVFFGATVDSGRRRHRDEAAAVIGSVPIAE